MNWGANHTVSIVEQTFNVGKAVGNKLISYLLEGA